MHHIMGFFFLFLIMLLFCVAVGSRPSVLRIIVRCNTCNCRMMYIGTYSPESGTYKCQKCNQEISLEISL